jgi:hypothetical protein
MKAMFDCGKNRREQSSSGQFPEIDDAVFAFILRETQDWNKLYCVVIMAHTVAL